MPHAIPQTHSSFYLHLYHVGNVCHVDVLKPNHEANVWQASVTTRDPIGCGIYQDKLIYSI